MVDMFQGDLLGAAVAVRGGRSAGTAPEADDLEQRVAHQAVAPVYASRYFAHRVQAGYRGGTVGVDDCTAVLVVQGRVDQQGLAARVDARDVGACHQAGELLFQQARLGAFQARRVEPYAGALVIHVDPAPFAAFAQDRCAYHVARLELVDEALSKAVHQQGTRGTHARRHQLACKVGRVQQSWGVILE